MSLSDLFMATGLAFLAIVTVGWLGGNIPRIGREQPAREQTV
jgi:hypothetical protein